MERFNGAVEIIWTIIVLALMIFVTYYLWNIDILWGIGSLVVCFGIGWHWWQDGGIHSGDDLDDQPLPYGEKVKVRFWENIANILTLPFRFISDIFTF